MVVRDDVKGKHAMLKQIRAIDKDVIIIHLRFKCLSHKAHVKKMTYIKIKPCHPFGTYNLKEKIICMKLY